jgi:FkbM family methyltransferase
VEPGNLPTQQTLAAPQAAMSDERSDWLHDLRMRVIELGIQLFWGKAAFPATMAADVPLMRGAWRMAVLRTLGAIGVQKVAAKSGLGYDFLCHIGDLSEYPYYHRNAFRHELAICAAWLAQEDEPVVFDVGANVGFFATQLVQILAGQRPRIYAFEPVPTTFAKLVQSVRHLHLDDRIYPVAAAILDEARPVHISFSHHNSLYAQVAANGRPRRGDELAHASSMTLDDFRSFVGVRPALIKIDVEGSEVAVLRGARRLLSGPDRPAIAFEYNPDTLRERNVAATEFHELLAGYALYYVDDFEGRKLPFGSRVARVEDTKEVCNLFAVPLVDGALARWAAAFDDACGRIAGWS